VRYHPRREGTHLRYAGGVLTFQPMVYPLESAKKTVAILFGGRPSTNGEPSPMGTCFFVEFSVVAGHSNIRYLVTAKHVLADLRKVGKAVVRLNNPSGDVSYLPIPLDEDDWLPSDDDTADVAVLPLPWTLGEDDYEIVFDNLDAPLAGEAWPWAAREGDAVAFTGLMVNFVGKKRNLLALRMGTLSLVTDELIQGEFGPSKYHVIDAQAYLGNSGAPVWVVSGMSFFVLGVLSAGYPTKAEKIKIPSTWRKEEYYNLAMSLVTPLEKVLDVIRPHLEEEGKMRKEKVAPVPLSAPSKFTKQDMDRALRKVSQKTKPSKPSRSSKRT